MYTPTGPREAQLLEAVNTLLDARRTQTPVDDLPAELQPTSLEEVYWVQDELARSYGQVGGWKVGAPTPEATPLFAPMPLGWMGPSGTLLSTMKHRFRGLEAEIAFLLGNDLPPRETPYSDDEVYAAVAGAHPAIEVIESGLADPLCAARNSMLADLQMHGAFIFGANQPDWRKIDFAQEHVTLTVDGSVRVERTGSNTAGNLLRLLPWLANEGAARTGGLRAGQWVTTGSWTGVTLATSGSTAEVRFDSMGKVALRFQ